METRGKKSSEALVTILPEFKRPDAPNELNQRAKKEWDAIVSRMPAEWFTRETHGILKAYCRNIAEFEKISSLIENLEVTVGDKDSVKEYNNLSIIHDRIGKNLVSMARAMRITQQSKYDPKVANHKAKDRAAEKKPWAK